MRRGKQKESPLLSSRNTQLQAGLQHLDAIEKLLSAVHPTKHQPAMTETRLPLF